jgi:hypothetical protein
VRCLVAVMAVAIANGATPSAVSFAAPLETGGSVVASAPADVPAAYTPVGPCRLADTRHSFGMTRLSASTIRIVAAGRCGVPTDATAIAITLTATTPRRAGFVTAFPAELSRPVVSNLNVTAGQTRANSALLALGAGGAIDVYDASGGHVVVDVTGAFTPSGPVASGRYSPLEPRRVLDTRWADDPVPARRTVRVPLPAHVPTDATALAVNLTVTGPTTPGFLTAFAAGTAQPLASVLNVDARGQTRAASAVVPVTADGLDVYSYGGGHLIVDVTGWFTGPSAEASDAGLFVATTPNRVLDTRATGRLDAGGAATVAPPPGSALAANWTIVDAAERTWVGARGARTPFSETSTVNAETGETAANFAITPATTAGVVAFADGVSHLLADVAGWFTGPTAEVPPVPFGAVSPYGPVRPGPRSADRTWRVLYVGDSLAVDTQDEVAADLYGLYVESVTYGGIAPCDVREGEAAALIAASAADLVVLSFLGNNLTPCTGYATGEALLQSYLVDLAEICASVAPARCIVVGQPALAPGSSPAMPPPDQPTMAFRESADGGAWGFVDAGASVERPDGAFDPVFRRPDQVHFSPLGEDRFAAAIADVVRDLIG